MSQLSRKEKEALLNEYDRRKSDKSLFYFGKHLIGLDLEEGPHGELCRYLDDEKNRSLLFLMPRGSFKTTVAAQLYAVKRIVENPNIRILLDSEILQNSLNNLGVIKRIFEGHSRFRAIYGDYVSKLWTQDSITVGKRTNITLKEPTISTASIETVQVGPHYDEIICDDLHSEKNSRTREQVEQVVHHFRLLFNLLEPGGRMVVIGTRWSDFDLYGRIIEEMGSFKVISRGAVNEDGSLFFPNRLTKEFLDLQRKVMGADIFNSQYMNNPLPSDENARFKREWFKYFVEPPKDMDIYIAVDPALPGGSSQDYFAIVVGGLTRQNDLYILDTFYGHWEPYDAISRLFGIAERYENRRLRSIGIETNVFQRLIKFQFEAEMRKRNRFYKVEEIKHYSERKEDRILSLQPRYETGAIFHHVSLKGGELEEELLKFPKSRKKDVIDAAASILEVAKLRMVRKKKENPVPPASLGDLINVHLAEKRKTRKVVGPLGEYF